MEKKNLMVFVDTTNAIQATDDALSAFTAGRVALISAEDKQATASGDISALTMGNGVQVAMLNADGEYMISDVIDARNIQMLTQQAAISAAGQVYSIDSFENIDCETEYCVTMTFNSPVIAKNYGYQAMKKTYSYVTRCCGAACGCPDGAAWDVAMGLSEQLNNDLESGMNLTTATAKTLMYARVLNSTSPTASNDPDEIWTLTKGSNIINCATDIDYASGTDVAAGDFIRIMNGGGTVTTAAGDVFRVEAASASDLTITLDRPWPYATQNLDTTGDAEVIPKATGEALADSTWSMEVAIADGDSTDGIVDDSDAGSTTYVAPYVVTASLGLGCNLDCNATVTETTAPAQPELIGYSVIQEELWANKGASKKWGPYAGNSIYNRPTSGKDYFATAATNYTFAFIIDYVDTSLSASTDAFMPRPKRIKIYTTGTTCSNEWNAIFDTLNVDFDVPFKMLG